LIESNFRNDSNTFLIFLKNLIGLLREEGKAGYNKYFLYLDNAAIHKTKGIKEYLAKEHQNVIYAVKYYPDYNMCENIFSMLKSRHYRRICNDM
jgi:hypothetical protein